ncbi:zinc ribbon domain-containing protein [Profundibacter amoris]|nr:zinc ribbon domain-containing protein [Profundibacter amoris]
MTQCPHCMTEIHDEATVCPSCKARKGYGEGGRFGVGYLKARVVFLLLLSVPFILLTLFFGGLYGLLVADADGIIVGLVFAGLSAYTLFHARKDFVDLKEPPKWYR